MIIILVVESGPQSGRRIWMRPGQEIKVGRGPTADWSILGDLVMSQMHFTIRCEADSARIIDENSTNGTFLNDEPIMEASLKAGDVIKAGTTEISVHVKLARMDASSNLPVRSVKARQVIIPLLGTGAAAQEAAGNGTAGDGDDAPYVSEDPALPETGVAADQSLAEVETIVPVKLLVLSFRDANGQRRIWLRPGHSATIGRSTHADFCIEDESEASPVHLALDCGYDVCRLRDLGSSKGSFLNELRVKTEAKIYDEDQIRIGHTFLEVSVEGGPAAPDPILRTAYRDHDDSKNRQINPEFATYTMEECVSGLTVFRDVAGQPAADDLFRRMGRICQPYILCDSTELESDITESLSLPDGEYLLDYLPEEIMSDVSPRFHAPSSADDAAPFMKHFWNRDGLVCFFSSLESAVVFERLRETARRPPENSDLPKSAAENFLIAYYWPSVLTVLLAQNHDFATDLMDGIEAVMIEGEEAGSWQIFAMSNFSETLQRVGYVENRTRQSSQEGL